MAQAGPAVEPSADPAKAFEPREFVGTNGKALKYRLIKPMGYKFGKKYPLVLFLHGAGERGDDNASTLKHAAKDFADLERRAKYPAYVVIPQCPTDRRWSEVDWSKDASALPEEPSDPMRNIKELLDEMVENAGVDPNRIYITGLSMGGYGTWDLAARMPDRFAAILPVCGGGDDRVAGRIAALPIWCFHGDADTAVPVDRSRTMIAAVKAAGGRPIYSELPGVGHDSWTPAYRDGFVLDWLFSQRK